MKSNPKRKIEEACHMDWEKSHLDPSEIKKNRAKIKKTILPPSLYKDKVNKQKVMERDALYYHQNVGATNLDDLLDQLAREHTRKPYCQWCGKTTSLVVEHEHFGTMTKHKSYGGRYRGTLCKRCNALEAQVKNKMTDDDKIEYLLSKGFNTESAKKNIQDWYF